MNTMQHSILRSKYVFILASIVSLTGCGGPQAQQDDKQANSEKEQTHPPTNEGDNPHAHGEGHGHGKSDNGLAEGQLIYPNEKHLKNVRQLTMNGDNAEAYWSYDDKKLVFQARNPAWGAECDQIYTMDPWTETFMTDEAPTLLSTGKGRTTCSYFMAGNETIIYASTHLADDACPVEPPRGKGLRLAHL